MELMIFFYILFGISLGILFTVLSVYSISFYNKMKLKKNQTKIFSQVLKNLDSDETNFNNRVNHVIQIDTIIPIEGDVQVLLFLDKKDISIFKGTECIYTSEVIDKDLLDKINTKIWDRFSLMINDVVYLQNNIIDRQTYMRLTSNEQLETKKKVKKNILTLDGVLDKINIVGYDNLTEQEKEFLKNCSK
jgi:hypothetical protein